MKLFVFKLRIPRCGAQRFSQHLLDSARIVGITLSESTRVNDDPENSETHEVFAFVCQAPAWLTPEQFTALMALCTIHKVSKILTMSYTDATPPSPVRLVAENGEVIDEP